MTTVDPILQSVSSASLVQCSSWDSQGLNSDVPAGLSTWNLVNEFVLVKGFVEVSEGFFIVKTLKFALNPKKWFPQRSTNQPPYLKDKPMWARFEGGIFCGTSFSGYGFCEGLFGILPQWFSVVAWSTSTGKQAKHIWVSNSQEHQFRNSQCPYYS